MHSLLHDIPRFLIIFLEDLFLIFNQMLSVRAFGRRVFRGAQQWPQNKKSSIPLYSKTCLKGQLKKNSKIGFQYQLSLNAGQKHCRMLQVEHSAILSTFIKLPFSIKTFVLSTFKWPLKTGFCLFDWFDSLHSINNLSIKQGQVFLGWTRTELG